MSSGPKIYLLSAIDDTPYHQGVEIWISGSLQQLIFDIDWSWMHLYDLDISEATLGQEGFTNILSDENIRNLYDDDDNSDSDNSDNDDSDNDNNNKNYSASLEEKVNNLYPVGNYPIHPEAEGNYLMCYRCEFITTTEMVDKDQMCDCSEKLRPIDDKIPL